MTVASGANFLVLDEPTNHLDLDSREALEAALEAFPGTLLLVSHDRALLDAVAERTLAIEDGELHAYDGGWAEMLRRREQRYRRAAVAPRQEKAEKPKPEQAAKPKPAPKPRRSGPGSWSGSRRRSPRRRRRSRSSRTKLAEDWSDVDTLAAHKRAATRSGAARTLGDAVRADRRQAVERL